jgi:copper transport protein
MFPDSLSLEGMLPVISLSKVVFKFAGYLASFAIFGALGFRFLVLRAWTIDPERGIAAGVVTSGSAYATAERAAARVGLAGAMLLVFGLAAGLAWKVSAWHVSVLDAVRRSPPEEVAEILIAPLLLFAFARVSWRPHGSWVDVAAVGVALALSDSATGQWVRMVNPLHEVAAALWLGTLLVLVITGLPPVVSGAASNAERGLLTAAVVARFSRLSLAAAAVVTVTGMVTGWRHLQYIDALWTTPYGYALDAKMCAVAIVAVFGFRSWRRMASGRGAEDGPDASRFLSSTALAFAVFVLVITAVIVSLPEPMLRAPRD